MAIRGRRFGKYNAKRTEVDGIVFASKREAARHQELKLLERAGEIHGLKLQPKFPMNVEGGGHVGHYIADFSYVDSRTGRSVVEDAKGMRTPVYRLKKRIVEAQYGIEIREV